MIRGIIPKPSGCRPRPSATLLLEWPLWRALFPADPRLRYRDRPPGGDAAAHRQDALGHRGGRPYPAPGAPDPPVLARHPHHHPRRRALWPARGHGLLRGPRRRLRPGPADQSRPSRRRDLAIGRDGRLARNPCFLPLAGHAAASLGSKKVPSHSMRCMITASLRARATLAFFMPALAATFAAQLLSCEPLTGRVRMMLAAS